MAALIGCDILGGSCDGGELSDMETFLEDFRSLKGGIRVLDFLFGLRGFLNVYELWTIITGSTRRTWESLPLK